MYIGKMWSEISILNTTLQVKAYISVIFCVIDTYSLILHHDKGCAQSNGINYKEKEF